MHKKKEKKKASAVSKHLKGCLLSAKAYINTCPAFSNPAAYTSCLGRICNFTHQMITNVLIHAAAPLPLGVQRERRALTIQLSSRFGRRSSIYPGRCLAYLPILAWLPQPLFTLPPPQRHTKRGANTHHTTRGSIQGWQTQAMQNNNSSVCVHEMAPSASNHPSCISSIHRT